MAGSDEGDELFEFADTAPPTTASFNLQELDPKTMADEIVKGVRSELCNEKCNEKRGEVYESVGLPLWVLAIYQSTVCPFRDPSKETVVEHIKGEHTELAARAESYVAEGGPRST